MTSSNGLSQPHPRVITFCLVSLLALSIFPGCSGGDGTNQQAQHPPLSSVDSPIIVEEDLAANVPSSTASTATETAGVQQPASKLSKGLAGVTIQSSGGANPTTEGAFDPPHNWPIIPLATMVMPDGKVLAYGTDTKGKQGATVYVVWDPTITPDWNDLNPSSSLAFKVYNNDTQTDLFCVAQTLLFNGDALLLGGDLFTGQGIRNNGNNAVTTFTPGTETLTKETDPLKLMAYPRWYPTSVTLPNQETLTVGGRTAKPTSSTPAIYPDAPEVRQTDGTWRTLTNTSISHVDPTIKKNALAAYGPSGWYYPRAWAHPNGGGVFIFANNGRSYNLNPDNTGTLSLYPKPAGTTPFPGLSTLASVMYATGKILSIRKNPDATPLTGPWRADRTVVVDITGAIPAITPTNSLMNDTRHYGTLTVLADGTVWASGGGALPQGSGPTLETQDQYAVYRSELWNGNDWTLAASATRSRLYHSTALLLPDGRVFTGGGGAPGFKIQRNGEIYNPPYLYHSNNELETDRPIIETAPSQTTSIPWGSPIEITADGPIARITLIRSGSATHDFNNEARFFDYPGLPTQQAHTIISITAPADANIAPPGYYMIFAWSPDGVPSVAKIIKIG